MTTWNYNRADSMPISYAFIMIRSAGAKFPLEYSDRNLKVKTQCVFTITIIATELHQLSGNGIASLVVSCQ